MKNIFPSSMSFSLFAVVFSCGSINTEIIQVFQAEKTVIISVMDNIQTHIVATEVACEA